MYLIKINIPKQAAKSLLADCQKMHQFVTGLFDTDRKSSQILFRTRTTPQTLSLYIYANRPIVPARCEYEYEQRNIDPWLNSIQPGQYLGFDLVAAACKKEHSSGKNSIRTLLRAPEERLEWLNRKASDGGFVVEQAVEQERVVLCGTHRDDNGGKMYHTGYHYQGVLQITNADLFRQELQNGIGPGKAYGLGMMMVKPI